MNCSIIALSLSFTVSPRGLVTVSEMASDALEVLKMVAVRKGDFRALVLGFSLCKGILKILETYMHLHLLHLLL